MTNDTNALVSALNSGKQITNGPQSISFSIESGRGYLSCDNPECCDLDFENIDEIINFIDDDIWEVVER